MTLGLAFLLRTRSRTPYDKVPAEVIEIAQADAGDGGVEGGAVVAAADAGAPVPVVPAKPTERPLRVVALGWELVAAGAALTAPDGGATGPLIEIAPETSLDAVKERLARGGNDAVGAD